MSHKMKLSNRKEFVIKKKISTADFEYYMDIDYLLESSKQDALVELIKAITLAVTDNSKLVFQIRWNLTQGSKDKIIKTYKTVQEVLNSNYFLKTDTILLEVRVFIDSK